MKYLIILLIFLYSCQNNENKIIETKPIYTDINGFYIFKKGMTLSEVEEILNNKNIKYSFMSLQGEDELIFDGLYYRVTLTSSDLKKIDENIQIIRIKNFQLLNRTFPELQVCFVNDKILYLTYTSNLEASYNQNTRESFGNPDFHFIVTKDIDLIKVISKGIEEKYGQPYERTGNLDGFYPSSKPASVHSDYMKSGTLHIERDIWLNKDSSFYIYIKNACAKDTFYESKLVETKSFTEFSVLFDLNEAKRLAKVVSEIEKGIEDRQNEINANNQKEKLTKLHKQIDSL